MSAKPTRVVIAGAGDNGLQAFYCLRHDPAVEVVGFLDDSRTKQGTNYLGVPILGTVTDLAGVIAAHNITGGIAAIGDNVVRGRVAASLRAHGLKLVRAIHPGVFIETPERVGEGVILEMGAAVHAHASVGDGVFMGTASMLAHNCSVGDFTILSGGVSTGGRVTIGAYCLIGVGASIRPGVTIGSNVVVGVGAAVVRDVPDNTVVAGVPARVLRFLEPIQL